MGGGKILMVMVDDEYIQLCIDEMNAIAEASQKLLSERFLYLDQTGFEWTREMEDRRRAELYKLYLDAAGLEIRRIPNA
jgi:hypothetical protein